VGEQACRDSSPRFRSPASWIGSIRSSGLEPEFARFGTAAVLRFQSALSTRRYQGYLGRHHRLVMRATVTTPTPHKSSALARNGLGVQVWRLLGARDRRRVVLCVGRDTSTVIGTVGMEVEEVVDCETGESGNHLEITIV
jgi:hypothetical protein